MILEYILVNISQVFLPNKMSIRCPSTRRRSRKKTSCLIRKTIEIIQDNYILYHDEIEDSINHATRNISILNEPELSELLYDILNDYDKHFTFSPLVDDETQYDKKFFSKWLRTKIIESDIGVVRFHEFPDFGLTKQFVQKTLYDIPERKRKLLCEAILQSFEKIKSCDSIVFDLRRNNGGDDWVAILMLSFIFGERRHVNTNVFRNERRKQYTLSPNELRNLFGRNDIPLLNNKNIFVLISRNTFSAAELFTYILQTFGKAIVIGEQSGGGANGGEEFHVNKNMKIFTPYFYCENPITRDNWEKRGVRPDIQKKNI